MKLTTCFIPIEYAPLPLGAFRLDNWFNGAGRVTAEDYGIWYDMVKVDL
ncbi:MAG: hypothetical protein ACE5GV_02870 [Candidatus Scalindua sp.]